MVRKHKLLIVMTAIILIPVLLGMTPMNLVQKLSSSCPSSQGKQIQRASSCLFNSIISQVDLNVVILDSTLLEQESTLSFHIQVHDSIHSDISLISVPLRC
jgi:hypothetical protein